MVRVDVFFLFLILVGKPSVSLSLLSIILAMGFQQISFIILGKLYSQLVEFIIESCWILSNAFSASIEMILWGLFFVLITMLVLIGQVKSATPQTIAHQVRLSMGFPRQEYWSRVSFPSLGIFLSWALNPHLLYWQAFFTTESSGKPIF